MITFRRICGVKAKDKWPLPSDFTSDVQDPTNIEIFHKVADITILRQQKEKGDWPKFLKVKKIRWNKSTLVHFAKEAFRGFKSKSRAETNSERGMLHVNLTDNFGIQKAGNLLSNIVIEEYKAQSGGIDPSPLIIQ